MSRKHMQTTATAMIVAALITVGLWSGWIPEQRAQAVQENGSKGERFYYGEELCSQCHNMTPEAAKQLPEERTRLYRGTEMHVWIKKDKHKNATKVLFDERGKLMAKNLGYDVTKSAQCLSCHGVHVKNDKEADTESFTPEKRVESGVTCVACHGGYRAWVDTHAAVTGGAKWKKLTVEDKAKLGLTNLWDPATRSAVCSSCHVGSAEEGRIVTHEMYAAGHPPLPGIEVVVFGNALPRHWETLTEKVERLPKFKDFYKEIHHFPKETGEKEESRLLAISCVGVFKATVELLADQAKSAKNWPDFANYDCYACHHDLKSESWRMKRPSIGVPGRPGMRPWSAGLIPFVIKDAGKRSEFNDQVKALQGAMTVTPFGKTGDVKNAADALIKTSNGLINQLHDLSFNDTEARGLLARLIKGSTEGEYVDFETARQMAWALKTLVAELDPAAFKQGETKDSPLYKLNEEMKLTLPFGPVRIVGPHLEETLKRMAAYNPDAFRSDVKGVAATIK